MTAGGEALSPLLGRALLVMQYENDVNEKPCFPQMFESHFSCQHDLASTTRLGCFPIPPVTKPPSFIENQTGHPK